MNIIQIDTERFEGPDDRTDQRPVRLKLLTFGRNPVGHHVLWKVAWLIQASAGKVENKRRRDNGHFDDRQPIILVDQSRNLKPSKTMHASIAKSNVDGQFSPIQLPLIQRLYGRPSTCAQNHAVKSAPELFLDCQPARIRIKLGSVVCR